MTHSMARLSAVVLFMGLATSPTAWAQAAAIQTECGGAVSVPIARIAAPYREAMAALKGSDAGWCAMAAEQDVTTPRGAALWEFVSAAYLLHALNGRKQVSIEQRTALQRVLVRIPGMDTPPSRLRNIDTALYVHARTLAAEDSGAVLVALDRLQ